MSTGLCECGCGQKTTVYRGTPRRYISGHNVAKSHGYYDIDPDTGCWNWSRNVGTNGYGRMHINRAQYLAHRYFYELHRGPIPDGAVLDHTCRNTICVNPDHLDVVTTAINTQRGRTAKLTRDDVDQIRSLRGTMTQAKIAAMFGIGQPNVHRILSGKSWK